MSSPSIAPRKAALAGGIRPTYKRQLFIVTAVLATLTGLVAATAPAVRAAKLHFSEPIYT